MGTDQDREGASVAAIIRTSLTPSGLVSLPTTPVPIAVDDGSDLDPLLGSTVGNFKLVDRIGPIKPEAIYTGEHGVIASKVSIRFLSTALAAGPSIGERFLTQARAASRINHERVARVFDLGRTSVGLHYLVMEHLQGELLSARLGARWSPEAAVELLSQICEGLQVAHDKGILHRDLRPENVFLSNQGGAVGVKLIGFGLGEALAQVEEPELAAYRAPECWQSVPLDARADIYSLGVIAHLLLTGLLPEEQEGEADRLAPFGHAVGPSLAGAVLTALSRDRSKRVASANAFKAELRTAYAQDIALSLKTPFWVEGEDEELDEGWSAGVGLGAARAGPERAGDGAEETDPALGLPLERAEVAFRVDLHLASSTEHVVASPTDRAGELALTLPKGLAKQLHVGQRLELGIRHAEGTALRCVTELVAHLAQELGRAHAASGVVVRMVTPNPSIERAIERLRAEAAARGRR